MLLRSSRYGFYFGTEERQSKQSALFASENTFLGDRLRLLGGDKPLS